MIHKREVCAFVLFQVIGWLVMETGIILDSEPMGIGGLLVLVATLLIPAHAMIQTLKGKR